MSLNNNDLLPSPLEQNDTILPSPLEQNNTSEKDPNIEDQGGTIDYIFIPSSFEDTKSFRRKRKWIAQNMLIPTNNSISRIKNDLDEKCFEEYRLEDKKISERKKKWKIYLIEI